jgi:SM-20-related protein
MATSGAVTTSGFDDKFQRIARELGEFGWSVFPDFLACDQVRALAADTRAGWEEGGFRRAMIGTGDNKVLRTDIRSDYVHWLDPASATPAQQDYLDELELLRLCINQNLYLGLFEFEGHLAWYPPGAYYRKHVDQFRGTEHRLVTAVLYLNDDWQAQDGGALRLYYDRDDRERYQDIFPVGGTLVTFLTNGMFHEVLPAQRDRLSITGWFRIRT